MSELRMGEERAIEQRKNERVESVAKQIAKFFIKNFSFSGVNFNEDARRKFQNLIVKAIQDSSFYETLPLSGSFAEWKMDFLKENKEKLVKEVMIISASLYHGVDPKRVKEDLWSFFEENPFPFKSEPQTEWRSLLMKIIEKNKSSLT